jgi:hypothetical protein
LDIKIGVALMHKWVKWKPEKYFTDPHVVELATKANLDIYECAECSQLYVSQTDPPPNLLITDKNGKPLTCEESIIENVLR